MIGEQILDGRVTLYAGDVFEVLADFTVNSVDCVVTSPPYWGLRDYGVAGQIGLEPTLGEHLDVMVGMFEAVRRVLKPTGTLWLNYGDCYATSHSQGRIIAGGHLKPKDLCMAPNRLAIALQDAGWWVRSEIVWGKPNPMPDSSGKYRPSTAHEKIFLLTKSGTCFYDHDAVAQPVSKNTHARISSAACNGVPSGEKQSGHGRRFAGFNERYFAPGVTPKSADENTNIRAKASFHASTTDLVETRYLRNYEAAPLQVWRIASQAFPEAHFATFPPALAERCILAGCPKGGLVLDPFGGAGTTALVALRHGRRAVLIDLNPDYLVMARRRIERDWRVDKAPPPQDWGPLFANREAAE